MLVPPVSESSLQGAEEAPGSSAVRGLGSGWTHVFATVDFLTGDFAVYLNGTVSYTGRSAYTGTPDPWGELIVGAEFIKSPNLPTNLVTQATAVSDLDIDQFRIYDRVLTATEISDMLWREPLLSIRGHIILDWGFDDPNGAVEADLSGHGADGIRGSMPSLDFPNITVLNQDSVLSSAPVVKPEQTNSAAPRQFNPTNTVYLASFQHPAEIQLYMPGNSTAVELLSVPSTGRLEADGRLLGQGGLVSSSQQLLFHAPTPWPEGISSVEFTLDIAGQEQHVVVHRAPECEPQNYAIDMINNELRTVVLGGQCSDGVQMQVEFPEAPVGGQLLSLHVDLGTDSSGLAYGEINRLLHEDPDLLPDLGVHMTPITEFPAICTDRQGVVVFWADQTNTTVDGGMSYRWLYPTGSSVTTAYVNIRITQENLRAVMQAPDILQVGGGMIDVQLLADDPDGPSVAGHIPTFRVVTGPRFGSLRQVCPGPRLQPLCSQFPGRRDFRVFFFR